MTWEASFAAANNGALLAWATLILLPRSRWLLALLRFGWIGALACAYTALIFVYFARAEGGGFGSLAQVGALFAFVPARFAGWIHYLAFDLFVGLWIASQSDEMKLSRLIQAPILLITFVFGPIGLLLFLFVQAALRLSVPAPAFVVQGVPMR